jgi:putative oxidoreductase
MNAMQIGLLPALGRLLMTAIFIQSGLGKLSSSAGTIGYIASHGLPAPQVAYWVAVVVELGGGIALLLGWQTRIIAAVLALFCLATAFGFHYVPGDMNMMIHFMKNISMAGGFLVLSAFGPGAWSLDALMGNRAKVMQEA